VLNIFVKHDTYSTAFFGENLQHSARNNAFRANPTLKFTKLIQMNNPTPSMISYPVAKTQIPLVVVVHEDDELLYNSTDCQWYRILKDLPDS
jgi:hypothetical protein